MVGLYTSAGVCVKNVSTVHYAYIDLIFTAVSNIICETLALVFLDT